MADRQAELERRSTAGGAAGRDARGPRAPRRGPFAKAPATLGARATSRPCGLSPTSGARPPALPTAVALREPDEAAVEQMLSEPGPEGPDTSGDEFGAALKAISHRPRSSGARSGLQAFARQAPPRRPGAHRLLQAGVGLLTFGDPQSAVLAFDRVAQDYPTAKEAPEAMMRLADCQLRSSGRPGQGRLRAGDEPLPGHSGSEGRGGGAEDLAEAKAAAQ